MNEVSRRHTWFKDCRLDNLLCPWRPDGISTKPEPLNHEKAAIICDALKVMSRLFEC